MVPAALDAVTLQLTRRRLPALPTTSLGLGVFLCRAAHPPRVGEPNSVAPAPAAARHGTSRPREPRSTRVERQGGGVGGPPQHVTCQDRRRRARLTSTLCQLPMLRQTRRRHDRGRKRDRERLKAGKKQPVKPVGRLLPHDRAGRWRLWAEPPVWRLRRRAVDAYATRSAQEKLLHCLDRERELTVRFIEGTPGRSSSPRTHASGSLPRTSCERGRASSGPRTS